jgi:hypothetical protein
MIFAWNDKDPSCGGDDWKYHGKNKITKSLPLLNFQSADISDQFAIPTGSFTHEMRMRDVTLSLIANFQSFLKHLFCTIG